MADKIITVTLSDFSKLEQYLDSLSKKIENTARNIRKDLSDIGLDEMKNSYAAQPYRTDTNTDFSKKDEDQNTTIIAMSGPQAIYNEFGTGTMGERNPHPEKGNYGLNPYNSGKTIRPATFADSVYGGIPEGEMFWTYYNENNEKIYTQGVPAGKEGYNAYMKIKENVAEVTNKRIKDALR